MSGEYRGFIDRHFASDYVKLYIKIKCEQSRDHALYFIIKR